jgi:hypothetical protein
MRLGQVFEVSNLPAADSFEPIPEGRYIASIEKVDIRDTKSGTGSYLNIQWKVTGPEYAGRVIFDMINHRNQSVKAQEIGLRQLSGLLAATGIKRLEDTDQLIGLSAEIKVVIEESAGFDPSNRVKSYKAIAGSPLPPPAEAPQEKRAPWQR